MKRKLLLLTASALMLCVADSPSIAATGIGSYGVPAQPLFPPAPVIAAPQAPLPSPGFAPQTPSVVTNCNAGRCTDSSGSPYIGGAGGNVYLNSNGKPCTRTGVWMQCG
jgi:hypothetical protein